MDYYFEIAEHVLCIKSSYELQDLFEVFPSSRNFYCKIAPSCELLFTLTIDDNLDAVDEALCHTIRTFDTGNGDTVVDKINNDDYQFTIKDIYGETCARLLTGAQFTAYRCELYGDFHKRCFGLNNVLMLAMAFAGSFKDTLLIHASTVQNGDYGYPFIAKSGTGKSTQVSNWLRYLPGCDLMNDDNPIIRIIENKPFIYGGPWSGKTPCYRNVKAPLGAITRIDRAKENSIDKVGVVEAFASLLPSVSSMKWDKTIFDHICNTLTKIIETTGIYTLHCRPDKESAIICNKAISKKPILAQ